MKVLLTGNKGFIGSHVERALLRCGHTVLPFDVGQDVEELSSLLSQCDFVIHLAGVNRPKDPQAFYEGNTELTRTIVEELKRLGKNVPIIYASSIQAALDNDYGKSKKTAEEILFASGLPVYVYRLDHVYGPGGKPFYNSVVSTFCHCLSKDRDLPLSHPEHVIGLEYVADVVDAFMDVLGSSSYEGCPEVISAPKVYPISVGELAKKLAAYREAVESPLHLPCLNGWLELCLFKTLLWYLKDPKYSYNYAQDERGSFEELYKSERWGQISENIGLPGVLKGGHYHTRKKEIFLLLSGKAKITQTFLDSGKTLVQYVDEDHPTPVDIFPNAVHTIETLGEKKSHTLMWVSEVYDPEDADTHRL